MSIKGLVILKTFVTESFEAITSILFFYNEIENGTFFQNDMNSKQKVSLSS